MTTMKTLALAASVTGLLFGSASYALEPADNLGKERLSKEALLTLVQRQTFRYFWEGAEPNSGMARERLHVKELSGNNFPQYVPLSQGGLQGVRENQESYFRAVPKGKSSRNRGRTIAVGGSGFGLMALLVGIERGFVTREAAIERLDRIVAFLEKADRFHGAWPHWLNGQTGKVIPFSSKDNGADLVETSYLAQGLLAVRQYLAKGSQAEKQLASRIDTLWREIEWDWFRKGNQNVLFWHWSPNFGWEMNHRVRGYNECLITYVLAAASPTHPIPPEVYHEGWARNGNIARETDDGGLSLSLKHNGAGGKGGPLFWAHYSYLGLDPRGLKDKYADYWQHNRYHTLLNRKHCIDNPLNYKGYGEKCWGLTASYSVKGYAAHRPNRDLGVISPTAALSSFPYAPEYSMQALEHFYYELGDQLWGPCGFYDAFSEQANWTSDGYLAIDQGPIIVMIENHRSGLLWNLFMSCPEVHKGLEVCGFSPK